MLRMGKVSEQSNEIQLSTQLFGPDICATFSHSSDELQRSQLNEMLNEPAVKKDVLIIITYVLTS